MRPPRRALYTAIHRLLRPDGLAPNLLPPAMGTHHLASIRRGALDALCPAGLTLGSLRRGKYPYAAFFGGRDGLLSPQHAIRLRERVAGSAAGGVWDWVFLGHVS